MSAWRRVVSVWPWWLGLWLFELAVAAIAGSVVNWTGAATMRGFGRAPGDNALFDLLHLLARGRGLAVGVVAAPVLAALAATVVWTVIVGFVIGRLAGLDRVAPRAWLGTVVQTLWHLLLRALAVLVVVIATRPLPEPLRFVVWVAVLAGCALALDAARTRVVLGEGSPVHPRTAWKAFGVVRSPRLALVAVGVELAQLVLVAVFAYVAVRGLGAGWASWLVRLGSLVSIVLGVFRLAAVVEATSAEREPVRVTEG